ncbi:hypothetical protein ACGFIR_26440 [Micromonospora sp. NPDC049051]|uniref:hypothetical protein n=1 Tax=Micromonospora sp. NPDC049051 TaxID=3364264 RepID=UPI00371D25FF
MFFRRTERPVDHDRLLDAARADGRAPDTADPEPLARLLAAAAAPTRPGELAGEEAAVAAFRAARAGGAAAQAPAPRRRRFTAGAVAWGAGIAITATAGAAFAAVTLDRADDPAPPPRPATPAPASTEPDRDGPTAATGDGHPTPAPPPGPTAAPTSRAPVPGTTAGDAAETPQPPAEQLRGLCRAYVAKKPEQREKALDHPSFARLVTAAGGRERVEDFCGELVPDAAAKQPPEKATSPTPVPTSDD